MYGTGGSGYVTRQGLHGYLSRKCLKIWFRERNVRLQYMQFAVFSAGEIFVTLVLPVAAEVGVSFPRIFSHPGRSATVAVPCLASRTNTHGCADTKWESLRSPSMRLKTGLYPCTFNHSALCFNILMSGWNKERRDGADCWCVRGAVGTVFGEGVGTKDKIKLDRKKVTCVRALSADKAQQPPSRTISSAINLISLLSASSITPAATRFCKCTTAAMVYWIS